MSDGMGRESAYLSSHATNRYFIPNWGIKIPRRRFLGASPEVEQAVKDIIEENLAEYLEYEFKMK